MASASPFHGDGGDILFLAADGNPPAIIFRIGVFGDGAPGVDAVDIGERIDVLLAKDRGDVQTILRLLVETIIGNPMGRDLEIAEDIGKAIKRIQRLLVHLLIDFGDIDAGS